MSRRLFVALVPPEPVRIEARRASDHLRRALPSLQARYSDPAATHLTLTFLGRVEEPEVDTVARVVTGLARTSRRFVARSAGLGAFPSSRRASVLWLGLEDPTGTLAELHRSLAAALPAGDPSQHQRFVPHLTVARVKTLRGTPRALVADALAGFEPAREAWPVSELVLFESQLRPEGARHTPLVTAPLAPVSAPEAAEDG